MNRDDIIRMSRETGICRLVRPQRHEDMTEMLERFAAIIAAAERDACAKVCDAEASRAKWNWDNDISPNQPFWNGGEQLASSCAVAIRARSNT